MNESLSPVELVEALCAEMRRRWQAGDRVPAEAYFERHPALADRPSCALRLVYTEVMLRDEHDEAPGPDEYRQRFPHLASHIGRLFEVHYQLGPAGVLQEYDSSLLTVDGEDTARATGAAPPAVPGYEVLGEVGRGGMGVVYRARHRALGRVVALKMIRAGAHASPTEQARFRSEAEAVARLQHPNIVQVFEVGEYEGWPYLALEYVEGSSLAQKLAGTPQPARPAAWLLELLARAMHHAHQRALIHRDLKPANILLSVVSGQSSVGARERGAASLLTTDNGPLTTTPKITDFGLAKRLEPGRGQGGAVPTQTGVIVGTPSYMAPEQAGGRKDIGPAADVYALGAILYECLTGRPPFVAEMALDVLEQVRTHDPVPPRRLQPKLPRDLETICLKCLRKEPEKRYASADALADDLRRFQAGEPIRARPVGRAERFTLWCRRNPARAALYATLVLVVLAAAVAGGGFGLWWKQQRDATVAAVEENLEQAEQMRREEKWPEAKQALDRAAARLAAGGPAWLGERIRQFRADLDIVDRLEEASLQAASGSDPGFDFA